MTIGEISQEIGLSADTLRYYEKIGLLPNVPRDNSGKRNYDENFINWIKFIQTLKNSGIDFQVYDIGINYFKDLDKNAIKRINIPCEMTGKEIIEEIEAYK